MNNVGSEKPGVASRIVIVDDHPLFRFALKQLLSGRSDLEVVAEAADGEEALPLCRRLQPEVVLMDVRLPKVNGSDIVRAIKWEVPSTIVLMVSAFDDPNDLAEALRTGADGYVLKRSAPQEIIEAIRKVLSNELR